MLKTIIAAVAIVASSAPSGVSQASPADPYQAVYDRLPQERMSQLVAKPKLQLDEGNLVEAERRFAQLLRSAEADAISQLLVADLEMAWGVTLNIAYQLEDRSDFGFASVEHLWKAAEAYERHFGQSHPETAIALASLSDALRNVHGDSRLDEVLALRRRAAAIFESSFGASHHSALDSNLVVVSILTSEKREESYLKEGLAIIDKLAATKPLPEDEEAARREERLAILRTTTLIRLGRVAEGLAHIAAYDARVPATKSCMDRFNRHLEIVKALEERGLLEEAARLNDYSACFQAQGPDHPPRQVRRPRS